VKSQDPLIASLSVDQLLAWETRMIERVPADAGGDVAILQALVRAYLFLLEALSAARVSVARLKRWLFGSQSEKRRNIIGKGSDSEGQGDGRAPGGDKEDPTKSNNGSNNGSKRKGHGRNGTAAYPDAQRTTVHHPSFFPGCPCPDKNCKGKLYKMKYPRVVLRIFGQPMLVGKAWEADQWRCNLCERIIEAPLPAEAQGPKYDETAVAMIAIVHFGNGFPFYRLEQHQASLRTPVPASTQSELLTEAFGKLTSVLEELIRQAAQFEILHNDDTGMKILAILAQIKKCRNQEPSDPCDSKQHRKAIHTTAIVAISLASGHRVVLYFTGTKVAGENLAKLLEHRDPQLPPPIHESDGLDGQNKPGDIRVMSGKCLIHARRGFVEGITAYPDQCRHVVEAIGEVYRVEALAKERKLSIEDRLLLHQEESGPIMDALHQWLTEQLPQKLVEPNSCLGKAIKYMLKRWEPLTLFLRQPGAPLDNNICERVLKRVIRLRKNSLFYKTLKGAAVGDLFMSLIETCALNQVNPNHYLTALLRNAHRIKESPGSWMPWNYQAMLREEATAANGLDTPTTEPAAGGTGPPVACPHPTQRETIPANAGDASAPP
jgi:hypothetical protein